MEWICLPFVGLSAAVLLVGAMIVIIVVEVYRAKKKTDELIAKIKTTKRTLKINGDIAVEEKTVDNQVQK